MNKQQTFEKSKKKHCSAPKPYYRFGRLPYRSMRAMRIPLAAKTLWGDFEPDKAGVAVGANGFLVFVQKNKRQNAHFHA